MNAKLLPVGGLNRIAGEGNDIARRDALKQLYDNKSAKLTGGPRDGIHERLLTNTNPLHMVRLTDWIDDNIDVLIKKGIE